ncbi:hypothetical protein [Enterococcus gallinarum]|uniref:hypothetical protein n=1 Tax=Enterococcus gallinarum TaxID=1353 RepID=UPI003D6B926A
MNEALLIKLLQEQKTTNSLLEIIANRIERNRKTVVYSSDNTKEELLKKIEDLSEEARNLRSRAEQAEKASRFANDELLRLRSLVLRHSGLKQK